MSNDAITRLNRINAVDPAPSDARTDQKCSTTITCSTTGNALRDKIFANQMRLKVIPRDAKFDTLVGRSAEAMGQAANSKTMLIRQVEVYARR